MTRTAVIRAWACGAVLTAAGLGAHEPAAGQQQPGKVARVGVLTPTSLSYEWTTAAVQWLGELGYVDGKTIRYEYRAAGGRDDRLPDLAADLARANVDVIITAGTPAIRAAQQASRSIPIVIVAERDPVAAGFVSSLARPGGNVTGITVLVPELSGKRLALLKEAVPRLARVGVLWNPTDPDREDEWRATQTAARALGLEMVSLEARNRDELEPAVAVAVRRRVGALVVLSDSMIWANAKTIAELAAQSRLAAVYPSRWFVDIFMHGGLMSYGPSHVELSRRAALYVDRILKGARPADLPVEQPSIYELVISSAAARRIGLTLPPSLMARADRIVDQ